MSHRLHHRTYDPSVEKAVPKDAIVLDIGSAVPGVVVGVLRAAAYDDLAEQIEAQMKPARGCEPGWGVVVEAGVKQHDERLRWVAVASGHWSCENANEYPRLWADLLDPVVVQP